MIVDSTVRSATLARARRAAPVPLSASVCRQARRVAPIPRVVLERRWGACASPVPLNRRARRYAVSAFGGRPAARHAENRIIASNTSIAAGDNARLRQHDQPITLEQ